MKNLKILCSLLLVVVLSSTFVVPSLAETYVTKYVTASSGSTVNLRKTASTSSTIKARVPIGSEVQAAYYSSTWSKVTYNGISGYMMSEFLTSTAPWIRMFGSANIYYGTRSDYVYVVQTTLISLGYSLGTNWTDYLCDDGTQGAIEDFQADQGLTVDGIVGPNTKKALYYAFINR